MSRDKGNRAPRWVAAFVRPWWPDAEGTPNGRSGADLDNTPGVAFEVKTGAQFRFAWVEQAVKYGSPAAPAVLVWLPAGMGEKSAGDAFAMLALPLKHMMQVLEEAGYAPARTGEKDNGTMVDLRAAAARGGAPRRRRRRMGRLLPGQERRAPHRESTLAGESDRTEREDPRAAAAKAAGPRALVRAGPPAARAAPRARPHAAQLTAPQRDAAARRRHPD